MGHEDEITPAWRVKGHEFHLLVCALPFLIGPWLTVGQGEVTLAGLRGPVCAARSVLPDLGCPGCGLTRSMALGVQGDLFGSLLVHPAGLLILILAAGGLLVHAQVLWNHDQTDRHLFLRVAGRRLLGVGLLFAWIAKAFLTAAGLSIHNF